MPMFDRDDTVDLDYGVTLRSADVAGQARDVRQGAAVGRPVRDVEPGTLPELIAEDGAVSAAAAALVGGAVEAAGMRRELTVPVDDLAVPISRQRGGRAVTDGAYLEVTVPAPGDDEGQVVLEVDAAGVLRWHLPTFTEAGAATSNADRSGGVQTFRIPVQQVEVESQTGSERGIVGFGFRKALHLLRFPIELTAGYAANQAVAAWERLRRPYGLRLTTPQTFTSEIPAGAAPAYLPTDEPYLLFVHGTFSRARAAFAALADDLETLHTLHDRYPGRVLVFDHQPCTSTQTTTRRGCSNGCPPTAPSNWT